MGYGYTASYLEGEPRPQLPIGPPEGIPFDQPTEVSPGVWGVVESQKAIERNQLLQEEFLRKKEDERATEFQRNLLKQVRVQDAAKAVEAAMRFQGMRGYERDLQAAQAAGLSPEQAATQALVRNSGKMFFSQPQAMVTALKALRPPPQVMEPTVVDVGGGVKGVRSGPGGNRFQFLPASATAPQHELGGVISVKDPATGAELGYVVSTGPNTGRFQKSESVAKLTPGQAVQALRAQSSVIQAQLGNAYSMPDKKERDAFTKTKMAELDQINQTIGELMKGTSSATPALTLAATNANGVARPSRALPLPAKKELLVKGNAYITKRGVAIWDGEKFKSVSE